MSCHTRPSLRAHRAVLLRIVALGCIAGLSLTACTSGGESDGGSSVSGTHSADGTSAEEANADRSSADSARNASAVADLPAAAIAQRAIERHGTLELRSDDVEQTRDAVVAAAGDADGYVASENSSTGRGGDLTRASLTLVVPTGDFDAAMRTAAEAGEVVSRRQSAEDVTDEVVDVASRVKSAEASLRRVRLLLGRADSLGKVIRLESVLGERQADLEALQARQRSLSARTSTATIDVTIRADEPDPKPAPDEEDDAGFVAGLDAGWDTLRTIGVGLLTGLGAVLPFVLAVGIPAAAVALSVQRLRRRRTPEAA